MRFSWSAVHTILTACLCGVLSVAAFGQSRAALSGRVSDASGAARGGARVKITRLGGGETTVVTDANGEFAIADPAPGLYVITVESDGFAPTTQTVAVDGAQSVAVTLRPDAVQERIDVRAPNEELRLDAPALQTGVSREEFAQRNNRRLGEVVRRLPGVVVTGGPGQNDDVRLRGLDKEFTRVQVDGVQPPDAGEKRELRLNRISSFLVQDVSVIRNPTAEYESDGLAGRVDVRTRPIPESLTVETRFGYGGRNSRNEDMFNGALAFGFKPTARFGVFGVFDYFKDVTGAPKRKTFSTRRGENEDELSFNASPNLFLDFGFFYGNGGGEIHFKPIFLNRDEDKRKSKLLLDGVRTSSGEDESERVRSLSQGYTVSHRHTTASGTAWNSQLNFSRADEIKDKTKLNLRSAPAGLVLDRTTLEPEDKEDRTWNVTSALALPLNFFARRQDVKLGGALRLRDRFRDKSRIEIDRAGRRRDTTEAKDRYFLAENYAALFIQDRIFLTEKLSVTPGVRYERVMLSTRAATERAEGRDFNDVNPSLHAVYRLTSNFSLKAGVSRGVNRPKFDELSPFVQETNNAFVIGNPALNPARAVSFDGGAEWASSRVTLGVNVFTKSIRGVIEQVATGEVRNGKPVQQVRNVGDGQVRGVELEQRVNLGVFGFSALRPFSLWSNQTALGSELREANGAVRRFKEQPRFVGNAGVDFREPRSGMAASVAFNYVGERREARPNGDVKIIEPNRNLDISVYQRLYRSLSLFVEVSNVTNSGRVEREMFANRSSSFRTERPGRTVLVGLTWTLR
jgi:outer membrane receptor protein involved in Fe transport